MPDINFSDFNIEMCHEVSCKVCKHRILKSDAKEIKGEDGYYCPEHKPPYDEVMVTSVGGITKSGQLTYNLISQYYRHIPATKVEVTKEGKEIKIR